MDGRAKLVAELRANFAHIQNRRGKIVTNNYSFFTSLYLDDKRRTATTRDVNFEAAADIVLFAQKQAQDFNPCIWRRAARTCPRVKAERSYRLTGVCDNELVHCRSEATWLVAMYTLGFSLVGPPRCLPMAPPNPDGVKPRGVPGRYKHYCAVCRKHAFQVAWHQHLDCIERTKR